MIGGTGDSMISRRQALVGSSALVGSLILRASALRGALAGGASFTPEQFGARGDGVTNDSAAFRRLAAAVNARGEGTIALRPVTYFVGEQTAPGRGRAADGSAAAEGSFAWEPAPLLDLHDLRGPLAIHGNGATLKCAPGLRYGTFDPTTDRPTRHPQPFYGRAEIASPYGWMVKISRCAGPIEIASLVLDGNLAALRIGGPWGDTGLQLPGTGLGLYDNIGAEMLIDVTCRDHPLDGIIIDGVAAPRAADSVLTRVICRGNGRQGCSIVGGHGYRFVRGAFEDTGAGQVASAPGAGVDLEAEGGKTVRAIVFDHCRFAANAGVGLLASEGDVADVTVTDCTFVATRSWGTWPNKPRFRFTRCRFAGAITNSYGSDDVGAATQFTDCTFVDDRTSAGGRRVYGSDNPDRPIAVLPFARNTRFVGCAFRLTADCVLPWSKGVIYHDCTFSQTSTKRSYPRGIFSGVNTLTGNVDINYSKIVGQVTVNGRRVGQCDLLS